MADYALKIIIDAQDRASGALRGVHGALQDLGGRVQQVGTLALGALAGGLGVLAGAATTAGAALAKMAVDAAPVEQVRQSFEGIAESAGRSGDEMLRALQQSSAGMISQRDLMLSFNRAAQLVGKDFAIQLPDAMKYLSKVAASTGEDMDYLLNSLVVGVGRLSPMILDNLGIQVSLGEATRRAAEMFDVEAGQLTKAQVQAGMMNVVLEKLAANTAGIPDVAGSAMAGLAGLRARFQDLKDQIGVALVPALSRVLEVIGGLADRYLPPLVAFFESSVAPAVQRVVDAFGFFFERLSAGRNFIASFKILLYDLFPPEVTAALSGVVDGIQQVIDAVRPYAEQAAAWIGQNVELKDVLVALGIAIAAVVVPALLGVVSAAAPVIAAGVALIAAVAAIRQVWENDFLSIRTFVENTLAAIQRWWVEHGEQVKATVQAFLNALKAIWERFAAFWREIFAAFRNAFEGDWYAFGERLRNAWNMAWENIKKIGQMAWDAIWRFFTETDWGAVGRAILEGIANGIRAGVQWLIDAARDAARVAYDAARGFLGIRSPSTLFAGIGEQMMAGMAEGILDASRLVERAMPRAVAPAVAAVPRTESRTVIIYGGLTVSGAQDAQDLLRQLWEMGYA